MRRSAPPASSRTIAVLLVVALIAPSSCSGGSAGDITSTDRASDTAATDTGAAGASATSTVASALADAAVAIIDAPAPASSAAVLTLTETQVAFMSEEAAARGGFRGGDLDAAGGGAPSGIPMSAVLAGYVRGVHTPGAQYSQTLMAGQDLTHPDLAVFPTVVLTLFAADAATAFATDSDSASETETTNDVPAITSDAGGVRIVGASAHRVFRGGVCTDVTKSIFDAVERIFAKIHIPPGKVGDTGSSFLNGVLQGLTDVVVGGLNFVIDAAKTLIVNGIKYLLDQVLGVVAEVAAAAALIGNFVSAVRPWRLELTAEASATSKGVEPDQVYDSVTAKAILVGPTDDWPTWFVDCAQAAGVTLPSLLPVDAGITWKVDPYGAADLMKESAHQVPKDTTMHKDPAGSVIAKIGLVTGTESAEQAESGQEQHGPVMISATARRDQITKLRTTLIEAANSLAGRVLVVVPAVIRDYLLKLVAEAADSSSDQVASLLDASGAVVIDVTYHGLPTPATTFTTPPVTSAPGAYCTLFRDFSDWSLANLEAVMAEASEPTFVVRDAFFTEYLQRMAAMQQVEPPELHDALATFVTYAQLYLSHDLTAVVAHAPEMTPAATLINGYGKTVCGYDPQVSTG